MSPERQQFLNLRNFPARVSADEAAHLLGFQTHEIHVLVANGLFKPLGNPAPNGTKYFALMQILKWREDLAWLDRATKAVAKHWRLRNQKSKANTGECPQFGEQSEVHSTESAV